MQYRINIWIASATLLPFIGVTVGCTSLATPNIAAMHTVVVESHSPTSTFPSPSITPLNANTASPVPTVLPSTPTPRVQVCSPLDGVSLDKIPEAIANPYRPPPLGSDNPHQGIDLAQRNPGNQIALAGLPVHAIMKGRVAAVLQDRFPFGNAVLIETPLATLPGAWLDQLELPSAQVTPAVRSALTCPPARIPVEWDPEIRSLYTLYAHLQAAPALQPGDAVACGQQLGNIGSSGNALNPHLHLEIRVGPSGARFSSMAHYTTSATPDEMANYCTWSVSGLFQSIDPVQVLALQP
jgi:murein DD-endopeptidase MepM/ murein hydrolase activator NlpD